MQDGFAGVGNIRSMAHCDRSWEVPRCHDPLISPLKLSRPPSLSHSVPKPLNLRLLLLTRGPPNNQPPAHHSDIIRRTAKAPYNRSCSLVPFPSHTPSVMKKAVDPEELTEKLSDLQTKMTTQRAFRLPTKGAGYDAIEETQEPIPKAHSHEVVLKIHAASLNYRDLAIATGTYPFPVKKNVIPLSDAAGTIVAVGPEVTAIKKGDYAIANFDITDQFGPQKDWDHGLGGPINGVARQFITLPASSIILVPKTTKLSWVQLAALVCTGTTAWNALYGNIPVKPGQTVLFQGTGGVSMTGLLLAKAIGATTIITSSSDDKLKLAKGKYGADHVINYNATPDWAAEVNKITEDRGADMVFEVGGSGTIAQSIACVARGGQIAVIGCLSAAKQEKMPDVASLVLGKGCVVRGVNVGSKQLAEDMARFACSKEIAVPIHKTFKFEKAELIEAYKELEKGGHVGKIAVQIL